MMGRLEALTVLLPRCSFSSRLLGLGLGLLLLLLFVREGEATRYDQIYKRTSPSPTATATIMATRVNDYHQPSRPFVADWELSSLFSISTPLLKQLLFC